MSPNTSLIVAVEIDAPQEVVWQAVTDWERQGDWMIGTTVEASGATGGRAVGESLRAVSGLGRLQVVDTMEITRWEPPQVCEVVHTGRVVRGRGVFRVEELPRDRSRFFWEEHLDLPLGPLGRVGWLAVRPGFAAGLRHSLVALSRDVAARYHAGT